jgi:hypothetical protein
MKIDACCIPLPEKTGQAVIKERRSIVGIKSDSADT